MGLHFPTGASSSSATEGLTPGSCSFSSTGESSAAQVTPPFHLFYANNSDVSSNSCQHGTSLAHHCWCVQGRRSFSSITHPCVCLLSVIATFLPHSFSISSFLSQSFSFARCLCSEATDQHHLGIATIETALLSWIQCHLETADTEKGHFFRAGNELALPPTSVLSLVSRRDAAEDG